MSDDARYSAAVTQAAWTITIICGFLLVLIVGAFARECVLPWWRSRRWIRNLWAKERGRKAQAGRT